MGQPRHALEHLIKQGALFAVNGDDLPVDVLELSWQDFEPLNGEAFRAEGFRVRETEAGPDGGLDLVLHRAGELYLVQCKRWRAQ